MTEMKNLKNILTVLCGNLVIAFSIVAFLEPAGIITGGTAGIGLTLQYWFGVPMFITVSIVNAVTFVVGLFVLGRAFALTTLLSTFAFPVFLNIFERINMLTHLTNDLLLCALLAGATFGIGIGITIRAGASTGGMDIPPLVVKKLYNIPVSVGMMVCNLAVLAMQVSFANIECILYGLVNVSVMSLMLNHILLYGIQQAQVLIISSHYEEIRKRLLSKDNGVTMAHIETGLTGTTLKAIICVVPPRKLLLIKQLVQEIDESSFMTINMITEVRGRGFSYARE
jgi:uncharacterized membrane-anchored protein YitT (DUF2179 family)